MVVRKILASLFVLYTTQVMYLNGWNNQEGMTFNGHIDGATCSGYLTSLSIMECTDILKQMNAQSYVMNYLRRYLICNVCYVSEAVSTVMKKVPGSLLVENLEADNDISQLNLARGKPTNQSSVLIHGKISAPSDLAVDDIWESNMRVNSDNYACAHTVPNQLGEGWWLVDLDVIYPVSRVVILNRSDCCGERLSQLTLTVGVTVENMWKCNYYEGPAEAGANVTIPCHQITMGRFVRIGKPGPEALQLCEVAVYPQ